MNNRTLRCVLVGLGRIGWQFHLPNLLRQPGFELVAVVDPDADRRNEAAGTHGILRCHGALEEVDVSDIDLAVIASPTPFHASQTLWCFERGVDVFCDKPAALNLQEAQQMQAAAGKNGRRLMVYQPHRLSTDACCAKKIMASGALGAIFMIERNSDFFSRRNDWQALRKNGGGMLMNYGSHFLDQYFYLTGDTCASVKCELQTALSLGDADDVVQVLLRGRLGGLFKLSINMATTYSQPSLILYGRQGTAWSQGDGSWRLRYYQPDAIHGQQLFAGFAAPQRRYPGGVPDLQEEVVLPAPEDHDRYYQLCYEYFGLGKEAFVPFSQTLEVMRTIELCRENSCNVAIEQRR
ncbi:MAG: Gfo/Idh/MocA family oxidoreductase [Salinivirgaceae bacterium]|nr:Gfo/Idh/MocA family oxidoreductase [Salinivirgaceae bacterium]